MWISRKADEKWVFKRFVQTQPELHARRWRYEGGYHERPDFVLLKGRIGVELGEWLHRKQTAAARELDRFETEMGQAAHRRLMTAFTRSFKPSPTTRYAVVISVKKVPARQNKQAVIKALLDFLRKARRPGTAWERRHGVMVGQAELPDSLAPFVSSIQISEAPTQNLNLGIVINRAGSFDPEVAVEALLNGINDKLVTKRARYSRTKAEKGLHQLWLVIHYGRGMLWNTPYDGLGFKEGRPLDEHTSRQILVERAREFVSRVGTGPFDRVFLLFDVSPGLECFKVWSEPSRASVPTG